MNFSMIYFTRSKRSQPACADCHVTLTLRVMATLNNKCL